MPKLTTYLPDVNVWLALASRRHAHSSSAHQWLTSIEYEHIAFCRITQMSLLRLLTNPKVMGVDVISRNQAWEVYSQIQRDPRVSFLNESIGVEDAWRSITQSASSVPGDWTDAYLLAFAKVLNLTFVTFDQAIHAIADSPVITLT